MTMLWQELSPKKIRKQKTNCIHFGLKITVALSATLVASWQLLVGSWELGVGSSQLGVRSWELAVGSW